MKKIITFCAAGLMTLSGSLHAVPVNLNFSTTLNFSPGTSVAVGGKTIGDVFQQAFGVDPSQSSSLQVTGTLTYDTGISPVVADTVTTFGFTGQAAGYTNAITGVSLNINGTAINADIPAIAANAGSASSGVHVSGNTFGLINPEFGGGDISQFSVGAVQSGNAALIGNELPVEVTGPSGTTRFRVATDFIGFTVGTTAIDDFTPGLLTDAGNLAVSSFFLAAIGNGTQNLFDSTSLPADSSFFNPDALNTSIIGLNLTLDGALLPGLSLSGGIESFAISAVPIPAAAWLFGSGLLGLGSLARRKQTA